MVSGLARRMNIGRPVRVLISRLTDSPGVVGFLRPVILIPTATLLNLSVEPLEAVLAHELAHVRRHDYLVNLLQTLAEALFFHQPAVWWVSSRIRGNARCAVTTWPSKSVAMPRAMRELSRGSNACGRSRPNWR